MPDICLISMPYDAIEQSSIAIGLLTSAAAERGMDAKPIYPKFWLADRMGFERYNTMATLQKTGNFLAEWTFAGAAFPDAKPDKDSFLQRKMVQLEVEPEAREETRKLCSDIRNMADDFIADTAKRIMLCKPRIVGCTSSFRQHCSSLALLRVIREMDPEIITMMGGANCEGVMGLANKRSFPWIDFVVSGEADHVFPELCSMLLEHGRDVDHAKLPQGVIYEGNLDTLTGQDENSYRATAHDLNVLPFPDYSGYFEELDKFSERDSVYPLVSMETSRGCWWGQKHPCTFCGLNGTRHRFRVKSPERILSEFSYLNERHNSNCFLMTDNILHMEHFKNILPQLATREKHSFFIQWEVKANLKKHHVKMLADAGVRQMQPGIENLDSRALKLLNKGVTAIQNVATLKYSMQNGIRVFWNYLTGIPGDDDAWYEQVAEMMPSLVHLQPPLFVSNIRYDRFGQYFRHPEKYNLRLKPFSDYFSVYPLSEEDMTSMAYFFEDRPLMTYFFEDTSSAPTVTRGVEKLREVIKEWQTLFEKYRSDKDRIILSVSEKSDASIITDTRPCASKRSVRLTGLHRAIHSCCTTPCGKQSLLTFLRNNFDKNIDVSAVEETISELVDMRLVLIADNKMLSLALQEPVRPMLTLKEFSMGNVRLSGILDAFAQSL